MPIMASAISEGTTHIYTPVIRQMAHRILRSLNYEQTIGDAIYINTDWMTHSTTSDARMNAKIGQQAFRVDAQVQLNPTAQKWDTYTFYHTTAYGIDQRTLNNTFPIYADPANRVRIIEMIAPVTIVLNCELTLLSAEAAFEAPIKLFNGHENGANFHFNDLIFEYPVPRPIRNVLFGLWEMDRIGGKPAGVNFMQYLKERTGGKWQMMKHREKEKYEIVVPVYDIKTLGTLEYSDDKPNNILEERLPIAFTIPFQYTMQFSAPTLNILQYPVVFNNQLVPKQYIPQDRMKCYETLNEQHHGIADEGYDRYHNPSQKHAQYIQLPIYDDWIIPSTKVDGMNAFSPLAILHMLVDESNPDLYTVENLGGELDPSFSLKPIVKEFLYQQGSESINFDVLYNISLYRDDKFLIPHDDFEFDEDLNIKFKARDLACRYRIVISARNSLDGLNSKWYPLLFEYFAYLNPSYQNEIRRWIETMAGQLGLPDGITIEIEWNPIKKRYEAWICGPYGVITPLPYIRDESAYVTDKYFPDNGFKPPLNFDGSIGVDIDKYHPHGFELSPNGRVKLIPLNKLDFKGVAHASRTTARVFRNFIITGSSKDSAS